MDALDTLIADHNRLRGLFARFGEAQDNHDTATMDALAKKIFDELDVHTALEEQIFYPAVHDLSDELAAVVDEGVQEHHVADVLIEEAKSLDPSAAEWVAKLTVLVESVEHHIEEEESELFPQVRSACDAAARKGWAERMQEMKAERGAPTPADAERFSTEELRTLARDQHIPGRSTMRREDLVATVDPWDHAAS